MRRAKIVATFGPAISSFDNTLAVLEAGAVAGKPLGRLELRSRGSTEPKLERLNAARREDLAPEREADARNDGGDEHDVRQDEEPARRRQPMQQPGEPIL